MLLETAVGESSSPDAAALAAVLVNANANAVVFLVFLVVLADQPTPQEDPGERRGERRRACEGGVNDGADAAAARKEGAAVVQRVAI